MLLETVLAFSVGVFAIFVGGVVLIVRFMVKRLQEQHERELHQTYDRAYATAWKDCEKHGKVD